VIGTVRVVMHECVYATQRQRCRWDGSIVTSPGEADGCANVWQRPRQIKRYREFAVNPERAWRARLYQRIYGDTNTDTERFEFDFAVPFHTTARLQWRPVERQQCGDVCTQAHP